jgi:hypothetical protein
VPRVEVALGTGAQRLPAPAAEPDDDAEWRRARARAESAARPALSPQRTPSRSDFDPFGPGGVTPIPPPATPLATWPSASPGARAWPSPLDSLDADGVSPIMTSEITLTLPPAPWYAQIVGGAAGIGGLVMTFLGFLLGLVFLLLGVLTLAAGFGVLGDRRWGYLAAGPAFAADAVFLSFYASGEPPAWVPPMALFFGAAAAALAFFVMLAPDIRARYGTRRGRV